MGPAAAWPSSLACVDIVQADVTRIGGITNMLRADGICKALQRPFSAHCAPAISAHVCCAMETLEHLEYFHDHVRIERHALRRHPRPERRGACSPIAAARASGWS